jgi:hypothetical protein
LAHDNGVGCFSGNLLGRVRHEDIFAKGTSYHGTVALEQEFFKIKLCLALFTLDNHGTLQLFIQ